MRTKQERRKLDVNCEDFEALMRVCKVAGKALVVHKRRGGPGGYEVRTIKCPEFAIGFVLP